jgi:hypothetical protein
MRHGAEGGGMRRAGRIIFNVAVAGSLLMLMFLAWLTWGDGSEVTTRRGAGARRRGA